MKPRKFSTLQIALALSVLAHAALLAVRFAAPETFNRVFEESPLEVILVNAKGRGEVPEKAQAVAQTSLAGGGDLAKGIATSPLPPSVFTTVGDSAEEAQRRIDALQEQQMMLLAQVRDQLAALPRPDQRQASQPSDEAAQEEKRRQLLELLAAIERRVNEENARPKRRYVSPATREAAYAVYVDTLRRRIEARGTERFPEVGGRKLYGELTMIVHVNHDGRLLGTEIVESSGNRELDRRAQAIVASIGNFGRFTDAMRRQTDQLLMPSRFKFTREGALETQVSNSSLGGTPAN
ncbi:TonB family protein [Xenophilus arseniciresistens]|uniref:TonB family protein n=1 Tax=Xenophilus arseniciresistens TaxID=1283306 RepID=A0AAE3NAP5_9BURK|nr:TonB family protein [Xenophilus arseniciresistens]MDA7417893.1 TonB family protein [Xenophilus arseniciresistens]